MGVQDSVAMSISLSAASSPSVASFNIPLYVGYHTVYPDRARFYSGGAAGLAQMLTDGFTVTSPLYKLASAGASQSPTVNGFYIGRRALAPTQTVNLVCVDGTVGDAYSFTIVGSDGKSHLVTYTNVVAAGAALASSATVAITTGTAAITYSAAQTQSHYGMIQFAAQPGVYYFLNANVASSTSATLTANYTGTTLTVGVATYTAPLSGTITVANGSAAVTTGTTQVGTVLPGDSLMFASQPGVTYTVLSVTASTITLTTPYSGTGTSTGAVDVCTASTAASAINTALGLLTNIGTSAVSSATVTVTQAPGLLNDFKGWWANGFQNIQLSDVTADPGIATDLAAIYSANPTGWYGISLDSNSALEIEAAQTWIEATGLGGKFGFFNNSDYGNINANSTSDLFSSLHTSGFKKCHVQHNNSQLLCYAGGSAGAWALSKNVGQYVMAQGMSLPGVPVDTDITLPEAFRIVLNTYTASNPTKGGKFGNFYVSVANVSGSYWGMSPQGTFCDLTIGLDYTQANAQAAVFGVISGQPKTFFNNFGLGQIGDAVNGVLTTLASSTFGFLDPTLGPIVVTVPPASSFTSAQRQSRNATGITFTAVASNGIESVSIVGTLTQ
jgi:hypothetical protein